MRIGAVVCAVAGLGWGSAATAQTSAGAEQGDGGFITIADARPGSPSNATSTVSASTVPQAMPQVMNRMTDTGDGFEVSLGTLYAEGDFGTDTDTSIWSSALGARYRTGDLRLTASLPWLRIRSNAVLFTGIDSTPVLVETDVAPGRRTADGFGDLTLGAAYTTVAGASGTEIEVSGRIKLDTATRSSGLSSGEKDYALGLQVTQPLGRIAPFATVTYRFLGDPAAYRLKDGFAASAGASLALGEETFVLASYHFSEAATNLVDDSHEVFAGASTRLPATPLRLTGFATAGLSRGAAGVSAGVALSVGF